MMEQSRLYLTICVLAVCGVSNGAYSNFPSKFAFTGVTFIGKLALSELFNFAPAEADSYPFFHRMGHYAKSSEESDEDEDENASHGGRIGLPKPQINAQNGDQCLAKLLCGMSVAASTKATKPEYYKDYAHLVSRYFQVFGAEDGSIESIEAYDDYSLEDDEPPPPPPKSKEPEKFDISLGFTSFLGSINNSTVDNEPTVSPKSVRNRGAGKLSQRLARAERIVANLNRQGRKPQPSHCQSLTGCSYSFKELRAKLKSGTKGKLSTSSSSSGKAPMRYKVHGSGAKPTSTSLESNEQQFQAFKDPNKGDDELDEIFGSSDAFAPAKPKKKKNQTPEPPPPPPIYIRRTIIKKKNPSGTNNDEESASTTIIRVAPVPIQPQALQNKPIQQADIADDTEEKPKRKVTYKKPPKKTKVKDNGDDEDDDINQTLPVKIITSDEYNDDHHKIYSADNGYQKDVPATPIKGTFTKVAKDKKKKEEDSDEEDEEEDEESEEEEEDEEDDESSKKRKSPIEELKSEIVVEDDTGPKTKLADDDEAAEAQKDFWGGLTFVDRKKEKEAITKPKIKRKYKVSKNKGQSSASNEEESKEDENSSKESEENDDKEDEKRDAGKKQVGSKISQGKLDIDIPPSAEHDLVFPTRKEKEKVSLKPKKEKDNKKKDKDDSSSEEENASIVITEIGGRPLAPPKEVSLKNKPAANVGQPSPFKLQFISPYPSKQQSSSYSSPSAYGGNINKPEKRPAAAAPLTSHAFLKSNLPTNADNTNVQGKPDMFSRISSLSPISSITNFFRKGSNSQQENIQDNAPPASPFMKRPVGPESSKFRRAPSRDKKKKKF